MTQRPDNSPMDRGPTRRRWRDWLRHPLILGILGAVACTAGVVGVQAWTSPAPATPVAPLQVVEVPIRPIDRHAPEDAERVTVTLRWGHTAADETPGPDLGVSEAGNTLPWDGYLALDCGDIERVEPLGLESEPAALAGLLPALADPGDRVGPVVRGDAGDQRVYWRSRTGRDWDGLRATLAICRSDVADGASTLRVVTPQKTYVARLDWSVDDFVSLQASPAGNSLDVHMASTRDRARLPAARVTQASPTPAAPMAAAESAAADSTAVVH